MLNYDESLREKVSKNQSEPLGIRLANFKQLSHLIFLLKKLFRYDCPLDKIEGFHVTRNVSADIMHDLNEGIVKIQVILYYSFSPCLKKRNQIFSQQLSLPTCYLKATD